MGGILSAIVLLVLIAVVVGVIYIFGRLLAGLVVNSILGLISIFAVNVIFGLGIGITVITIILVAIFGVPAVLVIVILKMIGISLP
ncbi:MAG: pro-sigmaK processing inhibitor BofA family protein [Candidatus Micrarchaeales archaeon]